MWVLSCLVACGDSSSTTIDAASGDDGAPVDAPPDALVPPTCANAPSGSAAVPAWDFTSRALGGLDVAIAPSGSVVVVGQFNEAVDFGGGVRQAAGNGDTFVLQLDAQGRYQWDHAITTTSFEAVRSVAIDAAGNVYVAGTIGAPHDFGGGMRSATDGAAYVVSYAPSGAYRWDVIITSSTAANSTEFVNGLAVGSTLVAVGQFTGDLDLGLGVDVNPTPGTFRTSTFVAGYDTATGTIQWDRFFRATTGVEPNEIALDTSGEVTIAGNWTGDVNFGGGTRTSAGMEDGYLLHLGETGAYEWDIGFGGGARDDARSIAALGTEVAATGLFNGTITINGQTRTAAGGIDGITFGTNAAGTVTWDRAWAGPTTDTLEQIAASSLGYYVTSGTTGMGTIDLGGVSRTFTSVACPVVVYSATGVYQWDVHFGGAATGNNCSVLGVATGPGGVIAVTGQFQGSVDFGHGVRTADGPVDAFVAALCP